MNGITVREIIATAVGIVVCILAALVICLCITGCSPTHPPAAQVRHVTDTPVALKGVASGLEWIALFAIVAIGVGVGLYFFAPETHAISLPLMGGAAAVEVLALVTRVSLWFIPWAVGCMAVGAIGFFIFELYKHRVSLNDHMNGIANAFNDGMSAATRGIRPIAQPDPTAPINIKA